MSKEKRDNKVKELIKLVKGSNLPQIILDTIEKNFAETFFDLKIKNEILIERADLCYRNHHELINKLPHEVASSFIYDYCLNYDSKDQVLREYNYYKGYKDTFYLLHGTYMSSVFIIFNNVSLQRDQVKYISDFSWGYIDLGEGKKRISGNTQQTADVILSTIFQKDKDKLNLIQLFIDSFLIENSLYQSNSSFSKDDILNWYNNLNPIKKVCLEQKLTYREFGEKVGFGEGAIKNAAASGKVSEQLKRAIEMYIEIERLTKENKKFKKFQTLMKEIVSL